MIGLVGCSQAYWNGIPVGLVVHYEVNVFSHTVIGSVLEHRLGLSFVAELRTYLCEEKEKDQGTPSTHLYHYILFNLCISFYSFNNKIK